MPDADAEEPYIFTAMVVVDRVGNIGIVRVSGDFDPATAPAVQQQVDMLVGEGCRELVLDLREVGFIDSAGLRVIVAAHATVHDAHGALSVRASDAVKRLTHLTGIDTHITIT